MSTWIHWRSPGASANGLIRSWSMSTQSVGPNVVPTAALRSSALSNCVTAIARSCPAECFGGPMVGCARLDLRFSPEDEAFRREAREWLTDQLTGEFAVVRGR